jgi:hypothetical protein
MLYNLLKVCVLPPSSVFFDHENRSDMFLWNDCLATDYMMLRAKLLITTAVRTWNPIWRHNSLSVRSYSLAYYILESRKKLYCHGSALAHLAVLVQLDLNKNGVTLLPQSSWAPCHHVLNIACSYMRWCLL